MILICSANFVGKLKDTLVGSLNIFGVKADFLPHLHQILNYFIKCKTLPAYLSDTAQNIPEVSTQRASKEWFLQASQWSAYAKNHLLFTSTFGTSFFLVISWTFQWPADMLPEKMGRFSALDPFVPMHPRKLELPTTLQPEVRSASLGYMAYIFHKDHLFKRLIRHLLGPH